MAAHVEAQFTSSEAVLLRQPNTLAFVQGKELGPGLLNIDEKWVVGINHNVGDWLKWFIC